MPRKIIYAIAGGFVVLGALSALAMWQRINLLLVLLVPDELIVEATDEGSNVRWFDDYYTIEQIGEGVFAISEPRYWQYNINYLIVGDERALLIDAGPGVRDINPVVKSLTDLPYTLMFSHFHYDHVGNGHTFPRIAMVDLPYLRDRSKDGQIQFRSYEHYGWAEDYPAPTITVDEWVPPGEFIDLGNRKVKLIYTPGHTEDSISIYDEKSKILFSGDWFIADLGVLLRNSSMEDNLLALRSVLCVVPEDVRIYPAHKVFDHVFSVQTHEQEKRAPHPLYVEDLRDSENVVTKIKGGGLQGQGFFPTSYKINDRMTLYSDIPWLVSWRSRYPELMMRECEREENTGN